jgi:glycosyltransferase involved in cell wall biosynthesis
MDQNDLSELELTILMPCLNEAETLATCIRKARRFLSESGVRGEVVVADNGSTDGSRVIAATEGARVVPVAERGYGAALIGGISAAKGRYVIIGDADDSYDFAHLMPFVEKLREGWELVMGNRFRGGIAPCAMPFLHRYLGNPVLSFIGRIFFSLNVYDFHCGLRGFNRKSIAALDLRTTGMEFASEMVVRAALAGCRITEVPTTLKKDGRSRPPHLRTWRDGWRHLRFLLMYSPKWLFFYPGAALLAVGIIGSLALFPGRIWIGGVAFDIHTLLVACVAIIVGLQSMSFAVIARRYATVHGLLPPSPRFRLMLDTLTLERFLLLALLFVFCGMIGLGWCVVTWASIGFGPVTYLMLLRVLMISLTGIAIGIQLAFTAFLAGIIDIPIRNAP